MVGGSLWLVLEEGPGQGSPLELLLPGDAGLSSGPESGLLLPANKQLLLQ